MPYYHQFLVSKQFGGAAKLGLGLARWLRDEDRPFGVWIPGNGPAADAAMQSQLPQTYYPLKLMDRGPLGRILGTPLVLTGLHGRRGVAHVHSLSAFRSIRGALRLGGMKTIVHLHLPPAEGEITWACRYPPDLIITSADFLVSTICDKLNDIGLDVRVVSVPNAVDLDRFFSANRAESKQLVGASPDRPLLLMVANLAPHKGQETAIRSIAILRQRGFEVECWFAGIERDGSGQYTRQLQMLIAELGVTEQVRFLGFRDDIPLLLQAADVLLLPSTNETVTLAILEAQASGLPVVASPAGGVPEIIHDGETGFLIPASDAAGYADRIQRLVSDPALARGIAERALSLVRRNHRWDVYCRRVGNLYDEVLQTDAHLIERERRADGGPR